mgnify:CR=1 FL=1
MSKTWKWIFGIVLVLVLVGAMFAIGYTWQTHMAGGWDGTRTFDREFQHPMMRGDDGWTNQPRMWERNDGWSHPMTPAPSACAGVYERGFTPHGGFFLLGGLVKLALFFGLIYGAYWLGRRNARITLDPAPAAPVDASATPAADPAPRKRAKKVQ